MGERMSETGTRGIFERGLDDGFVKSLNALYDDPTRRWWSTLVHHPEIFVAIRNNKLNAYYKGCSVAEIWCDSGQVLARTHYKYLVRPKLETSPYITAVDGKFPTGWGEQQAFTSSLDEIDQIIRTANLHAGREKSFVGTIVLNNDNVIDVEVAMTTADQDSEEEALSALRIDIAALDERDGVVELKTYEAKDYTNKKSLRSKTEAPVVGQIKGYEEILSAYNDQLVASYQHVAQNLCDLKGILGARKAWAEKILTKRFIVSNEPVLVVCGFDLAQKNQFKDHLGRLREALGGSHRVIAVGDAKNVKL